MKEKVIIALNNNASSLKERFSELYALFRQHPEHSRAQSKYLNSAGYSTENLEQLEYDIMKLYNVSEVERQNYKQKMLNVAADAELNILDLDVKNLDLKTLKKWNKISKVKSLLPSKLPKFRSGLPGVAEMKSWLNKKEVTHKLRSKKDLENLINETQQNLIDNAIKQATSNLVNAKEASLADNSPLQEKLEKLFSIAPEEVKQDLKLREEFPFLNNEDCPNELKILVADKITAFKNYIESAELAENLTESGASEEQIFDAANKSIVNYELNLEIYDELNYYKEHGSFLGQHPIFEEIALKKAVDSMSPLDLVKRRNTLRANKSRDTKKLNAMEAGDKRDAFEIGLKKTIRELELIEDRLEKSQE